jgi:hypothetical protein
VALQGGSQEYIMLSVTMVNLEELKDEISALGNAIKSLKGSPSDENKDAINTAVVSLLAAKKLYAENNNGVGVDGLPYVDPTTSKGKNKSKGASNMAPDGSTTPSSQQVRLRGKALNIFIGIGFDETLSFVYTSLYCI